LYCNCFKKKLEEKEEIDKYLDYLEKEIILIYNLNNKKIFYFTIFRTIFN
jgi:coproporphyrinogen III oxidase-like Fe-S oxidoreductase